MFDRSVLINGQFEPLEERKTIIFIINMKYQESIQLFLIFDVVLQLVYLQKYCVQNDSIQFYNYSF